MDDPSDGAPEPGDQPEARPDDRPAIRLDNVLKLAGIVETGGQAKRLIQAGAVKVNGEIETRRQHMPHEGDEVQVEIEHNLTPEELRSLPEYQDLVKG